MYTDMILIMPGTVLFITENKKSEIKNSKICGVVLLACVYTCISLGRNCLGLKVYDSSFLRFDRLANLGSDVAFCHGSHILT